MKSNNKLIEALKNGGKGIAIGVSMIIPGFSGGTIAVLMNIYDKILEAITGIFKHFKASLSVLVPLIIGAFVGFVGLVFPLNYGLSHIPLIIVSLFVGFIIGGIPFIYKKVQGKENPISIIIGLLAMALVIGLCFIKKDGNVNISQLNIGIWFYLMFAGFLSSIALVAPGISGSMTLMTLGVYTPIITILKEIMSFENLSHNILIIIPIALGLVIGFIVMSFLMKYLLSTYFAILGFIIGSIVTIYYVTITDKNYPVKFDALNIILSIVVLTIGIALTYVLERYVDKHSPEIKEKKE